MKVFVILKKKKKKKKEDEKEISIEVLMAYFLSHKAVNMLAWPFYVLCGVIIIMSPVLRKWAVSRYFHCRDIGTATKYTTCSLL